MCLQALVDRLKNEQYDLILFGGCLPYSAENIARISLPSWTAKAFPFPLIMHR